VRQLSRTPIGLLVGIALVFSGCFPHRMLIAGPPSAALASTPWCDADGDGLCPWPLGQDCDDADPLTYPGAQERPDLKDNDCDGFGDEPPVGFTRQGQSMQGFASAVEWHGDYVYVSAAAVLQVYHAPPGSQPELVHEIEFRDWVREMDVTGDTLFVAARGDGLFALDLAADPAHPALAGQVSGYFDVGEYTGITAVFNGVDASDNLVAVARANDVARWQGGVDAVVFDYDPATDRFSPIRAVGTEVRRNTAFEIPIAVALSQDAAGLYIGYGILAGELVYVPLDNPEAPVPHGDWGAVMDIATKGDTAFVALTCLDWPTAACSMLSRVRIVSEELVEEPILAHAGSSAGHAVDLDGNLLCFGTWSPGRYEDGYNLWAFTDLLADTPTRLGAAGTPDWIFQLGCRDSPAGSDWIYVADEWGGLELWESNGETLTLDLDRHRVPTGMFSRGMWLDGSRIYSVKEGAGLWVVDATVPHDEQVAVEWIDLSDPGCSCDGCCPPEEGAWPYPPAIFVSAGTSSQGRVALIGQDRNTAVAGDGYFMLFEEDPPGGHYQCVYSEPMPTSWTASWTADMVDAHDEILFVSTAASHSLRLYQHCPGAIDEVRFLDSIPMLSQDSGLEIVDVAVYEDYLFVAEVHRVPLADPGSGAIHVYRWKQGSLVSCPARATLLDPPEYLGSFCTDLIPRRLLVDSGRHRLVVGCSSKPTFPIKEGALLFYDLHAFDSHLSAELDNHRSSVSPGASMRVTHTNVHDLLLEGDALYVADFDNGLYLYSISAGAYVGFYPGHRGTMSQPYQPQVVQSPEGVVPLYHPIALGLAPSGKLVVQEHVPGRISILSRLYRSYVPFVGAQH
jgi:hypothetical protein